MKNLFRNIMNPPLYAAIIMIGLTIGIVSVLIISLWVKYEMGYDDFHEERDRIYKISQGENFSTVPPLFNYINDEFPEIESMIRLSSDAEAYINFNGNNNPVKVNNVLYSSPGFNDIFTVRNISGNIETGLNESNSIILSKKTALKIFGNTNVEGRILNYNSTFPLRELTLTVKSVVDDWPQNSTLEFDAIISFSALEELMPNGMKPDDNWRDGYCNMYLLLKKGMDASTFEKKLTDYGASLEKIVYNIDPDSDMARDRKLGLIGLGNLHFHNNNRSQLVGYISITGLLILIIALINYINLSVVKLFSASKSIYIRRVNGASRFQIIKTILSESVFFSGIAYILSLLIINLCSPMLTSLLNYNPGFSLVDNPKFFILLFFAVLFIGMVTGLYPALKLSANTNDTISESGFAKKKERNYTRQSLVIFQFTVSIVLIVSITIISKQLNFMNKKDMGFDSDQVLYTQLNKNLYGTYNSFKDELLKNPEIKNISGSQNALGQTCITLTREINGKERFFQELPVDPEFIETMGLELIKGRNFSREMQTDAYQTVILNETAVKTFELENDEILGTEIFMYDRKAKVIGVVKDFYFQSFHNQLDPFMLYYHPSSIGTANIKISSADIPETLSYIGDIWNEFSPDIPFEYYFLDNTFEELYSQDKLFNKIIFVFLSVAIIIACMGLFGLVSFTTLQRTKEIGIHKVNGAKITEVLASLNKDVVIWVTVAFIVATPIAYLVMRNWLRNFAYKTEMSWWIFALAGVMALGIALLTVSWQSWRAATRNPVEALRYE